MSETHPSERRTSDAEHKRCIPGGLLERDAYDERDGRRLTRASVTQRFEGDITGDGSSEWLMAYQPDGSARFVGLQLVEGEVAGRRGTFVLQNAGRVRRRDGALGGQCGPRIADR